jgi:hypothetical protein
MADTTADVAERARARVKRRLIAISVAAALGTAIGTAVVAPATPALASSQTVTVNFASTTGAANGVGAGFLYGLSQDGTAPGDGLLASLAPTSGRGGGARLSGDGWIGDGYTDGAGFTARIDSAIGQAKRLSGLPTHARYDLLLSDLYGADTTEPSNTVFPCANGNCGNWISFIDDVVADVQSAGLTVNYDIWNEPDNGSFWGPGYAGTQYFQMWDSAVSEIRRLVPSATIVGPSVSNFNNTYITEFLSHVKSAGTVPNYLNWHFSGTPVADAATVNGDLSADGISGVKLAMNEYLGTSQENAGDEAWYLAQLATSGISYADHAIWNYCCNVPNLDQTLVQNSGGAYVPTGQWWVYKDYADVTGRLAAVSDGSSTDAVAAEDSSRQVATVLLGDDAGNTGTVTLNLNGLSSIPWAFSSTGANVVVQRIPDQDPLAQPAVVSSQILAPGTASLSLPVNWAAANDAYFVTVTPADTGEVVADGAVSAPGPNYFQYGSGWGETTGVSDMYDGTANWSFTPGTTAVLHFTGNQVALHAVKDVDQGEMDISVDGSAPVTVDDYAPARNASGIVWTSPVLDPGPHVVTITVDSARNPASTGNNIAIDRADVYSAARVDADATSGTHFSYGSGWGLTTGVPDMYDGTANWSYTAGSVATLTFTGTEIALHAVKDVDQGIVDISVDGGSPAVVDDYSPVRIASGVVWTSSPLGEGTHTLTITCTGTHDSSSSGNNIALDSVDIMP